MGAAAPQRPCSRRRPLSRDQQVSEMPRAEMPRAELLAMPRALLDHVAQGRQLRCRLALRCLQHLLASWHDTTSSQFARRNDSGSQSTDRYIHVSPLNHIGGGRDSPRTKEQYHLERLCHRPQLNLKSVARQCGKTITMLLYLDTGDLY